MPLLDEVIAAHGGATRWACIEEFRLRVRIRGNVLALRFKSPRARHFEVTVDPRHVNVSLAPYPQRGQRGVFDGRHVRIETECGRLVTEREVGRGAEGVRRRLIWDDLDLLYFFGYALWNYAVTPFVFLWPGFECREGQAWQERGGNVWRRLHVRYPGSVPAHSREQTCYVDEAGLLRRIDYTAEVLSGRARAAHYCHAHKEVDGVTFPTHRVVFARSRSGHPVRLITFMEGWVDGVVVR